MKGPLLMVEIDPVVLLEGVLIGGKTELSGDDEVVPVRECNDEMERGISLGCAGVLLWKGRASGRSWWTKKSKRKVALSCCGGRQRGRSDHGVKQ